ncbi:MAG: hypothetical protein ACON5H_08870 [Akkermansiaceae bacterium]
MRIVLLHYHQRPSGVTQIIHLQRQVLEELGHEVSIPELPELDYCLESSLSGPEFLRLLENAIDLDPDLWLIHNPILGKNAAFPALIKSLSEKGIPLILQCHDFAEDGRPSNYQLLKNNKELYPIAPQVHYALINSRDASLLRNAGIPEAQIHFLPNAVVRTPLPPKEPDHPFVFYPVRGIRRKNLGEFCLWAKHAPPGTRFAVASRPENLEWSTTFDAWKNFAAREHLPIEFDVVSDEFPFEHWLANATHLATTSIAEGFGLTFIEPHFLGRPLIGRNLPEITKDFEAEGLSLKNLYPGIKVPLSSLDLPKLERDFRSQIEATFSAYNQKVDSTAAWKTFVQNDHVDFGNLPEFHQQELIQNQHFPALEDWLKHGLSKTSTSGQNIDTWSPERYRERMQTLVTTAYSSPSAPPDFLPKERVLNQFLDPDHFHFLRT